ncbi:MAG: CPBP family intramembrane metalloprotease [Candidatus Obscuribacter sp.]|nr:CPBP family intramembrane metalloprotease [Candidatus Obscuribacter sp.]
MSPDMIFIIVCSILGLIAHGSRKVAWLEWIIRSFILLFACGFALSYGFGGSFDSPYTLAVNGSLSMILFLILFRPFRKMLSRVLTLLDGVVSLRALTGPLRHKMTVWASLVSLKIYQEDSIPHLNGLFCFIVCFGVYLANTNLTSGFSLPGIPLPMMPLPLDQLFSYNGLGLIAVSACGCGLLVSRRFRETFVERLGWRKPTLAQVGIGLGLVVFSFTYDYVWSLFTHAATPGMASQISAYNSGTFSVGGAGGAGVNPENLSAALLLAIATALCAGIGEETLIRGAFQPVLGILPAAFLHGIMHGQFAQAPTLILQVAIWSCCMGIARRFTNTTTTIIGHAGYNLVTTFLFAFNP